MGKPGNICNAGTRIDVKCKVDSDHLPHLPHMYQWSAHFALRTKTAWRAWFSVYTKQLTTRLILCLKSLPCSLTHYSLYNRDSILRSKLRFPTLNNLTNVASSLRAVEPYRGENFSLDQRWGPTGRRALQSVEATPLTHSVGSFFCHCFSGSGRWCPHWDLFE